MDGVTQRIEGGEEMYGYEEEEEQEEENSELDFSGFDDD